jgi:hypothetical protein
LPKWQKLQLLRQEHQPQQQPPPELPQLEPLPQPKKKKSLHVAALAVVAAHFYPKHVLIQNKA